MQDLFKDLQYTLRLLRKSPGFAITAILTLSLGIGATTLMFSVLNTVLLRPLPYTHPEQLVQIWESDSRRGEMHGVVSPYNFLDWRSQSRSFAAMATYDYSSLVLSGEKDPVRVSAMFVTAGFFEVMKVVPFKGRAFLPGEDQPGGTRTAVISYGAWLRHFGADAGIIGKEAMLDDQPYTIVGVMPRDFGFPEVSSDFWCLPGFDLKDKSRRSHFLFAVGRLKSGVDLHQAQAEMDTIAGSLGQTYHQPEAGVRLVPLQEEIVGTVKGRLLVLCAAVVVVLLIACANVAGLLLARAVSRRSEFAIRSALGGSRIRLMRQLLTESGLLALIGGSVGVMLCYGAGPGLLAAAGGAIPRLHLLSIDSHVWAAAAITCAFTALFFGLGPAVGAVRLDLNSSLKQRDSRSGLGYRLRARSLFVVGEVALAMMLLVAGGLLIESLWRLQHVDAGFRAENVLSFRLQLQRTRYPDPAVRADSYERIVERLQRLPGVDSAGATNDLPFAGSRSAGSFDIEGQPPDPSVVLHADHRSVSPDYFRTMRMRLVRGRGFTTHDNGDAPFVSVINQAFVKKFFADEDPIGRRIIFHGRSYEVVGVVGDVKHQSLAEPAAAELYVPYLQADPPSWAFFVVRGRSDVQGLIASVRNAVKEVAPDEPIYSVQTLSQRLEDWISPQKFSSFLLASFAGLALVLAAIGIYGTIAYSVVQRTREIGVRMALGATRADVLLLIMRQGATIAIVGLMAGCVAAWIVSRTLSGMLFGVKPHDFGTFTLVAASLLMVVMLATYIPARKAMRVDPLTSLRYE